MRREFIKPPIEIMKATKAILLCKFMPGANNNNSVIFGISLKPQAKQTAPALIKCKLSRIHCTLNPKITSA